MARPDRQFHAVPIDLDGRLDLLERILRGQLDLQRRLLGLIERKREWIRTADIHAIEAACQEELAIAQKVTALEKHRLELIVQVTNALDLGAPEPLTISQIALRRPEPQQARLVGLAAQLREVLEQVKQQSSIVRAAADALARHMSGIMQTVQGALSRARVYSQRGRVTPGVAMHALVDCKS